MKIITYNIRLFIFWLIYYAIFRLFFLLFNSNHFSGSELVNLFKIFIYGIRLDLSAAAYCMLVPLLLISASVFIKGESFNAVNNWYHRILIFIINIICVSNIVIYKYWHTLLNKRALDFLYDPAEIFASLTTFQIVSLAIVYCILFIGFTWLFAKSGRQI